MDKVVKYCKLEVSNFQKKKVIEMDPVDIYREIKNIYLEWEVRKDVHRFHWRNKSNGRGNGWCIAEYAACICRKQ